MPERDQAELRGRLDAGLAALSLELPAPARERLIAYLRLLTRWNRAYNLSAIRDPREMVDRHLLDSLSVLPYAATGSLLDVGSGAGLPGLPLAIAGAERAVTLLDSNGKKVRFLRQAVMELGLRQCHALQVRADAAVGRYDQVTARAFTDLAGFWRVACPRLAAGGRALALKGRYPEAELSELTAMGVSWRVFPLAVPGLEAERHLVALGATGGDPLIRQD